MTQDQQIALAAVIASGSVGLAAVAGGFAGGILDRRHTREMARTDRSQARLESTYLELISYVHRSRMSANNIRPFVTYSSQPGTGDRDS